MNRKDPQFWSSCCGELADYIGYYRCTGCQGALHMGMAGVPRLLSTSDGAAEVKRKKAEAEVLDDCLF